MTAPPPFSHKPLRVLHIASGDLWAGAEAQLFTLAVELNRRSDIDLSVILLNEGALADKLREENINVTTINETQHSALGIFIKLIILCRRLKPAIIHTHRQKENVLGSIASLLLPNTISIRTVHGKPEHKPTIKEPHKYLYCFLDTFCAKHIQKKMISVSPELSKTLIGQYDKKNIVTIPNGVDIIYVREQAKSQTVDLPGPTNTFKVGLFGRMVPVKRPDLLLSIAQASQSITPNKFTFFIFGDGPLKKDIEEKIKEQNLGHILFVMGHKENPYPYLMLMDSIIITSDHEGLPMILLEAMALGTPVISRDVGSLPVILDQNCGTLVPHEATPIEFIDKLQEHQDKHITLSKNAEKKVANEYSSVINANQIIDTYRQLIQNGQSRTK